jgi:hypothetical protein
MKKIIITISCILINVVVFSSFNIKQESTWTRINDDLELVLPNHSEKQENLFYTLKKANPNIIFLRAILTSKNNRILFAVSRYENSESDKLDIVFNEQTVNYKDNIFGTEYKLISYLKYKSGNKILYEKVSSPIEGQCCVMYYFMKNNYSNVMYEIKLSGEMNEMDELKTIAEKIALSVKLY